jgi:hypothetical protein
VLAGNATAAPKAINGTVGPGFTITLKQNGRQGDEAQGGRAVPLRDQRSVVDSRLPPFWPGIDKVITAVGFTGSKSIIVKLKKGTYTFKCDPHASFMHGSFKVA